MPSVLPRDADAEFGALARSQWPTLVRSATLLGNDVHQAEDLAQATLLQCYLKWNRVESATDQRAYVARILINLHRQSRRRRWWRETPTEVLPDQLVYESTAQADSAEAVRVALSTLSPQHREVVVLRFYNDLSERQIAEALDIPAGTVKSRLSRALQRLSSDPHLADSIPEGTS